MPILTLSIDHGGRPVIELYVSVGAAEAAFRIEEGITVEPSVMVRALIDTGAGTSLVHRSVLESLRLEPVGEVAVHTASTGKTPVDASLYAVGLSLAGEATGLIAADLRVIRADELSGLRVEALLGRDVLDRCLLVYNGPAGQFTLAFDSPAHPE